MCPMQSFWSSKLARDWQTWPTPVAIRFSRALSKCMLRSRAYYYHSLLLNSSLVLRALCYACVALLLVLTGDDFYFTLDVACSDLSELQSCYCWKWKCALDRSYRHCDIWRRVVTSSSKSNSDHVCLSAVRRAILLVPSKNTPTKPPLHKQHICFHTFISRFLIHNMIRYLMLRCFAACWVPICSWRWVVRGFTRARSFSYSFASANNLNFQACEPHMRRDACIPEANKAQSMARRNAGNFRQLR